MCKTNLNLLSDTTKPVKIPATGETFIQVARLKNCIEVDSLFLTKEIAARTVKARLNTSKRPRATGPHRNTQPIKNQAALALSICLPQPSR